MMVGALVFPEVSVGMMEADSTLIRRERGGITTVPTPNSFVVIDPAGGSNMCRTSFVAYGKTSEPESNNIDLATLTGPATHQGDVFSRSGEFWFVDFGGAPVGTGYTMTVNHEADGTGQGASLTGIDVDDC